MGPYGSSQLSTNVGHRSAKPFRLKTTDWRPSRPKGTLDLNQVKFLGPEMAEGQIDLAKRSVIPGRHAKVALGLKPIAGNDLTSKTFSKM
jgi:hypothetical protein